MLGNLTLKFLQKFFNIYDSIIVTYILWLFLVLMYLAAIAMAGLYAVSGSYRLAWNLSDGLPQKLFMVEVGRFAKKGDYVAIKYQPKYENKVNYYPSGIIFIRIVTGIYGDQVKINNREVSINDHSVGFAKPVSRSGLPMEANNGGVIGPNEIFVSGLHKDSFDSRYEIVGHIKESNVIGRAFPIF